MLAQTPEVSAVTLLIGEWQRAYYDRCFALSHPSLQIQSVRIKNGSLSRNLWNRSGLPEFARVRRADIVHLAFPQPIVRRRFPCPVVATIHDLYPYDSPNNFGFPAYLVNRAFLRNCICEADALFCVSAHTRERTKEVLGDLIGDKTLAVTANIVDAAPTKSSQPAGLDAEREGFLLSVAQHRSNKRLTMVIKAFALLRGRGILPLTARLIIVGEHGPETNKMMYLVKSLSLADSVILASRLRDDELAWLYEHATAFVIASSIEGFCLPLVEALKHRARIVCSDIPILRELGGDRCHYFNGKGEDAEPLVVELTKVLSAPRPLPVDLQKFSAESLRPIYMKLYASLLN
jgi:glycosyltransferase involved in cell wall biosynthesis